MGRLKQLLPYEGKAMILHAVMQAQKAGFAPVIVVTGSGSASVSEAVSELPAEIAWNADWQSGMGSSIACGMRKVGEVSPEAVAVAILLADQPRVVAEHLRDMRAFLSPECLAVAAQYNGSLGVPAIFQRQLFPDLGAIPPEHGAKQILRRLGDEVIPFPLPEAAEDIDTPEDYSRLNS